MNNGNTSPLRLSVIIPTHNRANTIMRAIRSVLDQCIDDMEIIVVDDASTDDTEQRVRSLNDERIRYIRHETNRGAPAARNSGIAAANGSLIAFQDSDDEWMPDKLAKQLALFEAGGKDVDVVYCGFWRQSLHARTYIPEPQVTQREGNILQQLLKGNIVSTQTLLLRRHCFEKSGLFDEDMPRFQDWELAIRLAKHYTFHLIDEPLVIAYETAGNISSDDAAGWRALEMILEKHNDLYQADPKLLSHHIFSLGHAACLRGELSAGRHKILESLKIWPWRGTAWIALLAALMGKGVYAVAAATALRFRNTFSHGYGRSGQLGILSFLIKGISG